MKLYGEPAPGEQQDGYLPGAWDEVRRATLDGHISEEAYDVLRQALHDKSTPQATIAAYQALAQQVYDYGEAHDAEFFGGGAWGLATAFRNSSIEEILTLETRPEGILATASIYTSTTGGSHEIVEWTVPYDALEES